MAEAKHTPGPWSIHFQPVISKPMAALELSKLVEGTQEFSGVLPMVVGPGGLCTAVTGCGPAGVANARLIAAAPALLDALEKLMELERRNRVMPIGAEWDAARAALALVEGA